MHATLDFTRTAAALAAAATLALMPPVAHATVTYTYTGPDFDGFDIGDTSHPVTASGLVASFVFETALAPLTGRTDQYQVVRPVSWSISGGGYTLGSNVTGATLSAWADGDGILVYTDAAGTLQGWDIFAYLVNPPDDNGPRFRSFYYPTGAGTTSGDAIKTDAMTYWNVPVGLSGGWNTGLGGGSWAVSAVPEPGSMALWLAGACALGWMVQRRRGLQPLLGGAIA